MQGVAPFFMKKNTKKGTWHNTDESGRGEGGTACSFLWECEREKGTWHNTEEGE